MKISKYKEISIDDNSKIAIYDYNIKKRSMNIMYYKIFLGMCILVNIGLFLFIFIYQYKIQEIEYLTSVYSSQSKQKGDLFNQQQTNIDKKLTNLIAISKKRSLFFSYSFLNQSEFDLVKNFIIDYTFNLTNPASENFDLDYEIEMIYQSSSDYFKYVDLVELLNHRRNCLIIVNTLEDEKFGIYLNDEILFDSHNKFISEGKHMFLFSFRHKKMIKYIGKNSGIKIDDKSENIITIGNDEIIIYNYFYNFGGAINYPLDSFEKIEGLENNFIQLNGNFDIKNIEIFEITKNFK
jgi:hypothetical protein